MYDKITAAYRGQKMVCLQQKNHTEDFFVGIIEGYDERGLLLYSLDRSGRPEEHIYFPIEAIGDIIPDHVYLDKIRVLASLCSESNKYLTLLGEGNLLETLLLRAYQKETKFSLIVRCDNDRLQGYIRELFDDYLELKVLSESGKYNGHARILKAYLECLIFPLEFTK